jgi:hypothetical protein
VFCNNLVFPVAQAAAANVNNDISDDDIPRAKKQQLVSFHIPALACFSKTAA